MNSTWAPYENEPFCKWLLYWEMDDSRVRIWDLVILTPNALFLLLLAIRMNKARLKLRATSSPIFYTFYALVMMNATMSVVRCVVAMSVNAALPAGHVADKVLWVAVRFFLLATELSVLTFGLAFGHLDSKTSIRRVLLCTSFVAFAYSGTQGALEIATPDESFHVVDENYDMFGHGGMLFWFVSSIAFFALYGTVFLLPWTSLRDRLPLPSKPSFYSYVLFLAALNAVQAVGSGLLYYRRDWGLCVVDVTTYVYFTLFTPLVYKTFLCEFFGVAQPNILFSYKPQADDVAEEDVGMPHQLSCSSLKTDSDYIYQTNSPYDSTRFDRASPLNPLYAHSLQSPDDGLGFRSDTSVNSDFGYRQLRDPDS